MNIKIVNKNLQQSLVYCNLGTLRIIVTIIGNGIMTKVQTKLFELPRPENLTNTYIWHTVTLQLFQPY